MKKIADSQITEDRSRLESDRLWLLCDERFVCKLLSTNCGSPHYCKPEGSNGTSSRMGNDGAKGDVFSIAVICLIVWWPAVLRYR